MKLFSQGRWFKLASLFSVSLLFILGSAGCKKSTDPVTLTLTSWRTEDVAQMNRINALFTKTHPNITINFQPYEATAYDDITSGDLANGAGADIIFLRSYDKGRALYDGGYLSDLTDVIPNLASYSPVPVKAWSTEDGITYGVPSAGVTHGIYYQKSLFEEYNIREPVTWDEFIAACEKLLLGGETVLAQGAQDAWTLNFVVFSGLTANFYGGEVARQALMAKEMKLTDPNFIEAFQKVQSLQKYLPEGYKTLGYEDSRELFGSGKAAMFIGGSWEISVFESLGSGSSRIGWFAPPVKKAGDKLQYCFHVDAGIGLNKKCKHSEEAIEYIKWVAGSEYAQNIMDEIPGFFSYTPGTLILSNPLAQEMFDAASTASLTVRLMSEKLNAESPTGDALMDSALKGLMTGTYTPETAAAYVQDQLDTWYLPGGK